MVCVNHRVSLRACIDEVTGYLHDDNAEEQGAGSVDLEAEEDHDAASKLAKQVEDDEEGCQEFATAPRDVHVLPLLVPLEVHADTILQEGGDEAEPGQGRQEHLRPPQNLFNVRPMNTYNPQSHNSNTKLPHRRRLRLSRLTGAD